MKNEDSSQPLFLFCFHFRFHSSLWLFFPLPTSFSHIQRSAAVAISLMLPPLRWPSLSCQSQPIPALPSALLSSPSPRERVGGGDQSARPRGHATHASDNNASREPVTETQGAGANSWRAELKKQKREANLATLTPQMNF